LLSARRAAVSASAVVAALGGTDVHFARRRPTMIPAIRRTTLALVLLALPASVLAQTAAGPEDQVVHLLEIRGGRVMLDGEALPADALPPDLDIEGVEVALWYSGAVVPVLNLDGLLYSFRDHRLVPFEGEPNEVVYGISAGSVTDHDAMLQASHDAYLRGLSERDRQLYLRLMREQQMEIECHQLAKRVRLSADEDERRQLTGELRGMLEAVWELKEENRRDEIRQVEAALQEMRQRLTERERVRGQIIDQRLRALTLGH
jgi:hypothetical protein